VASEQAGSAVASQDDSPSRSPGEQREEDPAVANPEQADGEVPSSDPDSAADDRADDIASSAGKREPSRREE
jgi:hypothetical protein